MEQRNYQSGYIHEEMEETRDFPFMFCLCVGINISILNRIIFINLYNFYCKD